MRNFLFMKSLIKKEVLDMGIRVKLDNTPITEFRYGDIFTWTKENRINHKYAGKISILTYEGLILLEDPRYSWNLGIANNYFSVDKLTKFQKAINERIENGTLTFLGHPKEIIISL